MLQQNPYYTALYTIKDPSNPPTFDEIADNIKGYVSEEQFKAEIADRKYQIPDLVAKELKKSIEVLDVNLEEQSINENGTIDYTYTTVLKVYDENSSKIYEKEGELTISTINNELKITREWSRGVKIEGKGLSLMSYPPSFLIFLLTYVNTSFLDIYYRISI
ncbi:hypothetical protein J7E52_13325 [Bacillus sp. ISL-34]|uniref:hypothetical protein n=1 Tax=Bacillus sp. ISL-34 TaxID=2819121 RepID=UPI001BE7B9F7|nr:hypothetical protein [Bacillus sp. ISL-34]MBT2647699.1 hypothetical protein [Bacillus sp. ISL-34]